MIINLGDAPFKAFITVTYPGGTCTVTGNGQTYSHTGGGTHTFTVKKKGTYTVSGDPTHANGICTSKTVSVSKWGQTQSVTLTYTLTVFNSGDVSAVSGGWGRSESKKSGYTYGECMAGTWSVGTTIKSSPSSYYNSAGTDAAYATCTVYSKKAINVTEYSTLKVTAKKSGPTLRLGTSTTGGVKASKALTNGTISLNVSSLTGSYYIQFYDGNCEISKIEFT